MRKKNPLTEVRGLQKGLVEGSDLQASASLELHNVLGSDLDGGTRLWVAAVTCSALAHRERAKTNERNAVTFFESAVDGTGGSVESTCSVRLRETCT